MWLTIGGGNIMQYVTVFLWRPKKIITTVKSRQYAGLIVKKEGGRWGMVGITGIHNSTIRYTR